MKLYINGKWVEQTLTIIHFDDNDIARLEQMKGVYNFFCFYDDEKFSGKKAKELLDKAVKEYNTVLIKE